MASSELILYPVDNIFVEINKVAGERKSARDFAEDFAPNLRSHGNCSTSKISITPSGINLQGRLEISFLQNVEVVTLMPCYYGYLGPQRNIHQIGITDEQILLILPRCDHGQRAATQILILFQQAVE
jgi:hypothetical protein